MDKWHTEKEKNIRFTHHCNLKFKSMNKNGLKRYKFLLSFYNEESES